MGKYSRIKNPEAVKEYNRQWRLDNPTYMNEYNRQWRIDNVEKVKEYREREKIRRKELHAKDAEARRLFLEKMSKAVKAWFLKNPEKYEQYKIDSVIRNSGVYKSKIKARNKLQMEQLSNAYIKQVIRQSTVKGVVIPEWYIELKRQVIKVKRAVRSSNQPGVTT